MDPVAIVLVIFVLGFVVWMLTRSRRRQAKSLEQAASTAPGAGLSIGQDLFTSDTEHHAPVAEFHVHEDEAIVTFDVPLSDEDDEVFNELLVSEAVEVVREKKHTLPIDGVTTIVVYAGRGERREVGRTQLHAAGELPASSTGPSGLSFAQIAHDPFAAPFEERSDHSVVYDTKSDVPDDELGPLVKELKLPIGLQRGLRALGVDPDDMTAEALILNLFRMFGYSVTEQASPGSYLIIKDGLATYVLTEPHVKGSHPELSEAVCNKFIMEATSSGAARGLLITGKYSPFMIHEIEARQPTLRFITRERVQGFIDRMALG